MIIILIMNCLEKFKEEYFKFFDFISQILPTRAESLNQIKKEIIEGGDEYIMVIGSDFINGINKDHHYRDYLLNKSKRLFLHDETHAAIEIIPGVNMKRVFQKLDQQYADEVWTCVQKLYIILMNDNDEYIDFIKQLSDQNHINIKTEKKPVENMIDEIAETLQKNLEGKENPLENIGDMMNIALGIGTKYKDQIESGKITKDDMSDALSALLKQVTGEDISKNEIENPQLLLNKLLSKNNIDSKEFESTVGNLLSSVTGASGINNTGGIGSMLNGLSPNLMSGMLGNLMNSTGSNNVSDQPLTDEQIAEMEKIFSTMNLGQK